MFFEDVVGEERQEGEKEEEEEVGVEGALVGLVGAVDEVVVVDPVDADEGEAEEIDCHGGDDLEKAGEAVGGGDFEVEDHDGDDDGDDAVGEGFEASRGCVVFGHGFGGRVACPPGRGACAAGDYFVAGDRFAWCFRWSRMGVGVLNKGSERCTSHPSTMMLSKDGAPGLL